MEKTTPCIHQARAFQNEGRFLAAADLLLKAFREEPADGEIARELGLVVHATGDFDTALHYLLRAHHSDPADEATLAGLLQVLQDQGRHHEAAHLLLAGVQAGANPDDIANRVAA